MKKGITAWPEYDRCGHWCLIIEKEKGLLSLEDIMRTAREWEWDYYLLQLDCYSEDFELNFTPLPDGGDRAILYRAEDAFGDQFIE